MLEKYDGVRGFWNPKEKAFYSRFGNKFMLPSDITTAMPNDIFLDGEFWYLFPPPLPQISSRHEANFLN